MNSKHLHKCFTILPITVLLLAGCGGSPAAAAPTIPAAEAIPSNTPTAELVTGIETPITVDGVEMKIVQATSDPETYDMGPFAIKTDPGILIFHVEAQILSGEADLKTLATRITLHDEDGKECQMVAAGVERSFWQFMVPEKSKSFSLKFSDGQTVLLDSILNQPLAGDVDTSVKIPSTNIPSSTPTVKSVNSGGSKPFEPAPAPSEALAPSLEQLTVDTLKIYAKDYDIHLGLIEAGYLSSDNGEKSTELLIKVRCLDSNCTPGVLFHNIIFIIENYDEVPSDLATFHIQVQNQQGDVIEDVVGDWSDLMKMHNFEIDPEDLYQIIEVRTN